MPRKLAMLAAALMMLLEIPSCSFTGLSAQNLMSPPKANADQQSIYKAMQGAQTDVTFIYPRNGEYRSAIIMRDFTGDGAQDAIGFHTVEGGGVEVQFLMKEEEEWRTAAAFVNIATQVDRVCFAALPGGGEAVLIGWGSTAGVTGRTAAAYAYLYDGDSGDIQEFSLGVYGEMTVTDFDGDGANELFTIDKYVTADEEGAEPVPASARLYAFDKQTPYEIASTQADNDISNYTSMTFGQLNAETQGVVVDGSTADGRMTTQIFLLDGGVLTNYPMDGEETVNPFSRPSTTTFSARDINGDGFIELPTVVQLPGIPEDVALDSTSYMVEWQGFSSVGSTRLVLRALMNPRENYWFRLPYELRGRVCAINDVARRTVTYTEVVAGEDGSQRLGSALFAIRVFTQSSWESRGETSGYTQLTAQNDSVYGMQVFTKDPSLLRYVEDIAAGFQLLTE